MNRKWDKQKIATIHNTSGQAIAESLSLAEVHLTDGNFTIILSTNIHRNSIISVYNQ